jgi:protein-export membrane protein SecD
MVMLALVTLMTVISALYVWPGWPKRYLPDFIDYPQGPIVDLGRDAMRLGLDLQGGTYVLTQADTAALPPGTDIDDAMEGVEDVIERRVNATGVAETEVTREGKDRLAVQLPGISPDEAAELIGKTALLEFRTPVRDDAGQVVCTGPDGSEFSVPATNAVEGVNTVTGEKEGQCTSGPGTPAIGTINWEPATALDSTGTPRVLTGSFVKPGGAEVIVATQGCLPACVTLEFSSEGGLLFQQITEDVVGYPLAIFLDEELVAAPAVNQTITGGNAVIEGLEVDEAETLAIQINAGSLPVPLETIQQKEIEATLGEETLVKGVQAGIIGVLAVMFFMIVYYRLPGILSARHLYLGRHARVQDRRPDHRLGHDHAPWHRGLCPLDWNGGGWKHPCIRAHERRAPGRAYARPGDRARILACLVIHPRQQRFDTDHVRDPVVVW